jgi:hypothetical protein
MSREHSFSSNHAIYWRSVNVEQLQYLLRKAHKHNPWAKYLGSSYSETLVFAILFISWNHLVIFISAIFVEINTKVF